MTSDLQALDQEIARLRQALAATPPGAAEWASRHADLGAALRRRYDLTGELADLDAAIAHLRDAVAGTPADHPDRARRLVRLGDALLARYKQSNDEADLDAGVTYLREAGVPGGELRKRIRQTGGRIAVVGDFADWDTATPPAGPATPAGGPPPPPAPAPQPYGPAAPSGPAGRPGGGPPSESGSIDGRFGVTGEVLPPLPSPQAPSPRLPDVGAVPSRARRDTTATPAAPEPATDQRLEFAAAYRRAIEPVRRYPVLFFLHRPDARDQVRALIERRAPQLGGAPAVAHAAAAQAVESGTTVTIVPNVLGAAFEPSRIDVTVDDAVRELTFQMAVPAGTPVGPLDGYIDIFVGPLIIGQVPVGFEVHEPGAASGPQPSDTERFLTVANASIFDKIFVSYSRRDSAVVDLCVSTYQGLGVRVLVDRLDLRSGDDWRASLERMIQESNIFQLYWSSAAAASQEVHHEWRLALALSKTRDRFIRPLYWEQPMPPPPEALGHLHFSQLDLKLLRRTAKAYSPDKPGILRRALTAVLGAKA